MEEGGVEPFLVIKEEEVEAIAYTNNIAINILIQV